MPRDIRWSEERLRSREAGDKRQIVNVCCDSSAPTFRSDAQFDPAVWLRMGPCLLWRTAKGQEQQEEGRAKPRAAHDHFRNLGREDRLLGATACAERTKVSDAHQLSQSDPMSSLGTMCTTFTSHSP